ncbi:MAG: hypothetical protein ACRD0P_21270 [Stackebrandtia sp.]
MTHTVSDLASTRTPDSPESLCCHADGSCPAILSAIRGAVAPAPHILDPGLWPLPLSTKPPTPAPRRVDVPKETLPPGWLRRAWDAVDTDVFMWGVVIGGLLTAVAVLAFLSLVLT